MHECVNMPLVSPALPRDAMIDSEQRQNSQFSVLFFHTDSCSRLLYEKVWLTSLLWQVDALDIDYTV